VGELKPIRVVFWGTPAFALPALESLYRASSLYDVVAVVTQPDKPRGRGKQLLSGEVAAFAREQGIMCLQPERLKDADFSEQLHRLAAEVFVVAAYGKILPKQILEIPPKGCVNIHASLLPQYRGASPIAHSIWHGDAVTGITLMQMDEGMDTGPIWHQAALSIASTDTTSALSLRLANLGAEVIREQLAAIVCGEKLCVAQDHHRATYTRLLRKEDGLLDFTASAERLERQIRSMLPWPRCYTYTSQGRRLLVFSAVALAQSWNEMPGTIQKTAAGIGVACGEGVLELGEIQPEGGRRMSAQDFMKGRGIFAGEILLAERVPDR
jgi:methionyl-tRNA formyltransferase